MNHNKLYRTLALIVAILTAMTIMTGAFAEGEEMKDKMLFQGHGSFRFTTAEGKVIYVDPSSGEGYDQAADLILITHAHPDHNMPDLIANRNEGCQIITWVESLEGGEHHIFDLGFVTVEAVEAGNNPNHKIEECVGFILTFPDGVTFYVSGDTSTTEQMATFAERGLDYAALSCDGKFNMDIEEAATCANQIAAKHTMPCHMAPGTLFDQERADAFAALVTDAWIVPAGEEVVLEK